MSLQLHAVERIPPVLPREEGMREIRRRYRQGDEISEIHQSSGSFLEKGIPLPTLQKVTLHSSQLGVLYHVIKHRLMRNNAEQVYEFYESRKKAHIPIINSSNSPAFVKIEENGEPILIPSGGIDEIAPKRLTRPLICRILEGEVMGQISAVLCSFNAHRAKAELEIPLSLRKIQILKLQRAYYYNRIEGADQYQITYETEGVIQRTGHVLERNQSRVEISNEAPRGAGWDDVTIVVQDQNNERFSRIFRDGRIPISSSTIRFLMVEIEGRVLVKIINRDVYSESRNFE